MRPRGKPGSFQWRRRCRGNLESHVHTRDAPILLKEGTARSTRLLNRRPMRRSPATPSIPQRNGRRRGVSSLGSIRSVYAVEDLPKSWTISCRSERVENHWMTGTCRASAGHAIRGSQSRMGRGTGGRSTPTEGHQSSWSQTKSSVTILPSMKQMSSRRASGASMESLMPRSAILSPMTFWMSRLFVAVRWISSGHLKKWISSTSFSLTVM